MSCLRFIVLVYACFSKPYACIGLLIYRRVTAVILSGWVSGRDKIRGKKVICSCGW
jgi:hypothetical protein